MLDIRIRSRLHPDRLEELKGKVLSYDDYGLLVTQDARITGPDGQLLAVYLKAAINPNVVDGAYNILTTIREITDNRGYASGSSTVRVGKQTRSFKVNSAIVGSFEADNYRHPMCRLTGWTGRHVPEWERLRPYIQAINAVFARHVPDRYAKQKRLAESCHPAWVIPDTAYSTLTVNNTYATGVHVDDGDYADGFSCLSVIRKGDYLGGEFCIPEYRLGFDMDTGDVLLMQAHEWHGNVQILHPDTGEELTRPTSDYERISTVLYMRNRIVQCKSPDQEVAKAKQVWSKVRA